MTKKLLQLLNSLNETHAEQIPVVFKIEQYNYLENQESSKLLIYLKHELIDIDLEFKNRLVISNYIIVIII
jgi:hypothetical protein